MRTEGDYSETYSLTAYGDGVVVQLQFGVTNLGLGSGRAICRLYAQGPGARVRKHAMFPHSKWRSYGSPVTSIVAPACRIISGAVLTVEAGFDHETIRVATTRPLMPVLTPQTALKSPGGFYQSEVLLAASPAELIWVRGKERRAYRVYAHVDHSVTTLLPGAISDGWLRFRALHGDRPMLFSVRLAHGGKSFSGWQWRGEPPVAMQIGIPAWWPASATGLVLELPGGKLTIGRQIEVFEPLRDLGLFRRAAEVVVGRPKTVLFWAELNGQQGLLEVATQD
jgi:hypothetical protein